MVLCNDSGTSNNAVDEDRKRPRDVMIKVDKKKLINGYLKLETAGQIMQCYMVG